MDTLEAAHVDDRCGFTDQKGAVNIEPGDGVVTTRANDFGAVLDRLSIFQYASNKWMLFECLEQVMLIS